MLFIISIISALINTYKKGYESACELGRAERKLDVVGKHKYTS